MEYQKIINLLDNTMINHLNLEPQIDLKKNDKWRRTYLDDNINNNNDNNNKIKF